MKGYTAGVARRRSGIFPYVELWKQPLWRWVLAHVYHWWEKFSWPAMKRVEKWHRARYEKDDGYVPLSNRQDIRCYHLSQAGRNTLAIVYMTEEQYAVVTGKKPKSIEPRTEAMLPVTPEADDVEVGTIEVREPLHEE